MRTSTTDVTVGTALRCKKARVRNADEPRSEALRERRRQGCSVKRSGEVPAAGRRANFYAKTKSEAFPASRSRETSVLRTLTAALSLPKVTPKVEDQRNRLKFKFFEKSTNDERPNSSLRRGTKKPMINDRTIVIPGRGSQTQQHWSSGRRRRRTCGRRHHRSDWR